MDTKTITFHPKQKEAFNCASQFIGAIGGVQSGKTFLGCYWAYKKAKENMAKNGAIIAPSYKILQQSTLQKFFYEFPQFKYFYKDQKGVINLPKGGKIFIRSADEPLSLEGMTLDWAWLDEAGMMSPMVFTVIRSRVSATKGQVLMTTTPYNMGWLYQDFYVPAVSGLQKDYSVFTWASIENPHFDKDFFEKEKSRLRVEEFSRRYMGQFQKMTGLVYALPDDQIIFPVPIPNPDITIAGVDWGFKNPAAISVLRLKDKEWFIIDEWKETEKTTKQILEQCLELKKLHKINRWYPDPAEPDRIAEMQKMGFSVFAVDKKRLNAKDTQGGISFVQTMIAENRLFVFGNLNYTLDEFNTYHYPEEKEGVGIKDEPEKDNDHLMDAIRYALYSYEHSLDKGAEDDAIEREKIRINRFMHKNLVNEIL